MEQNQYSKVAAVIVTHNRLDLLKKCLVSVRMQTVTPSEIIVVNNGCTDDTAHWLANYCEDCRVVSQPNLGSSGGQASGIEEAYRIGAEFVWLMDDDVVCEKESLHFLLSASEEIPNGSFYCSVVRNGNRKELMNVPSISTRRGSNGYPVWQEHLQRGIVEVGAATFVSLLVRMKAVQEIGLPIRDFFIWGDDTEFTQRLSSWGPGFCISQSVVLHLRNSERPPDLLSERFRERIAMHYFGTRNRIYLLRVSRGSKVKKLIRLLLLFAQTNLAILKQEGKWLKLKTFNRGFFAGLFFRPKIPFLVG